MEKIEFGELRIGEKAKANLMHVCDTNCASGGPKVRELEKKWSSLFDYDNSIAVSSGTDGCINSCFSLYDLKNAKRGVSEVICPALSFTLFLRISLNFILLFGYFLPILIAFGS